MIRAPARERLPILLSVAALVGALIALAPADPGPGLLNLSPALLLLAALAFDRYPGERLVAAVACAWQPAQPRERRARPRLPLPARSLPRGGVLVAMALAGRGPPG